VAVMDGIERAAEAENSHRTRWPRSLAGWAGSSNDRAVLVVPIGKGEPIGGHKPAAKWVVSMGEGPKEAWTTRRGGISIYLHMEIVYNTNYMAPSGVCD
jgi:hypothetical protein